MDDANRALVHLNGAAGDKYTGRRWGTLVALHRMKASRGVVRLALVCDCGAYNDASVEQLDQGRLCATCGRSA